MHFLALFTRGNIASIQQKYGQIWITQKLCGKQGMSLASTGSQFFELVYVSDDPNLVLLLQIYSVLYSVGYPYSNL